MGLNRDMYYQVRGPRATYRITRVNTDDEERVRTGTTKEPVLRFESLLLTEAEKFATEVYRQENIICTIDEVQANPVTHHQHAAQRT